MIRVLPFSLLPNEPRHIEPAKLPCSILAAEAWRMGKRKGLPSPGVLCYRARALQGAGESDIAICPLPLRLPLLALKRLCQNESARPNPFRRPHCCTTF